MVGYLDADQALIAEVEIITEGLLPVVMDTLVVVVIIRVVVQQVQVKIKFLEIINHPFLELVAVVQGDVQHFLAKIKFLQFQVEIINLDKTKFQVEITNQPFRELEQVAALVAVQHFLAKFQAVLDVIILLVVE